MHGDFEFLSSTVRECEGQLNFTVTKNFVPRTDRVRSIVRLRTRATKPPRRILVASGANCGVSQFRHAERTIASSKPIIVLRRYHHESLAIAPTMPCKFLQETAS